MLFGLSHELAVLALGCILGFVHIIAAGGARTSQHGMAWNMSARDETLPLNVAAGRLARAQANYFETFPIVAVLLLAVTVAGRDSDLSAAGAWLWLIARAVYLPVYRAGVAKLRSFVFLVATIGMFMILTALLIRP